MSMKSTRFSEVLKENFPSFMEWVPGDCHRYNDLAVNTGGHVRYQQMEERGWTVRKVPKGRKMQASIL